MSEEFKINVLLRQLKLQNYRGFEGELSIDFDNNLTVFIGNNGSGKTSILDAIHQSYSYLIGRIIPRLKFQPSIVNRFDVNNKQNEAKIILDILLNESIAWQIDFGKNDEAVPNIPKEIESQAEEIFSTIEMAFKKQQINELPIYKFIRSDVTFENGNGLLQTSLSAIYDDYNDTLLIFFKIKEWFKWQQNKDANSVIFNQVKNALYQTLSDDNETGFQNIYIDWETPEGIFTIEKGSTKIYENQLSSGEKRLFALVGEIAMRLCLANPHKEKPLEGQGIVLIDEIDLHLHPRWQRKVIPKLREIFPNVQFVVTTHSALVLNSLDRKNLRVLKNAQIINAPFIQGRDTNSILLDAFDTSERSNEYEEKISQFYTLLENNIEQAKIILNDLKNAFGENDEEIIRAESYLEIY
jgi:predicted ATP-binding protein involved in virulence